MPTAHSSVCRRLRGSAGLIVMLVLVGLLGLFARIQAQTYGEEPTRDAPEAEGTGLTFGSQRILNTLWSPHDLQQVQPAETYHHHLSASVRLPTRVPLPSEKPWRLPMSSHTSIRRVDLPPQHKVVALTFDLCEGAHEIAGYDALIVDYLRQQDIPATFFAGGRWMQHHEKRLMQLMADPLFEIGNHSWSHANLRVTRGPRLIEEIQRAQTQYEEIYDKLVTMAQQHGIEPKEIEKIPSLPLTFRFPYGACSAEALHAVAEAGLPAIQWDVVSGDPAKQQTVQGMTATVLHHAKSGSIVIFHANGRGYKTAAALPGIIAGLRVRQFTFVTVSQLLELGRRVGHISAVDDCYEWRPGDNRRYDRQPR